MPSVVDRGVRAEQVHPKGSATGERLVGDVILMLPM
jgi:hypothetical protein